MNKVILIGNLSKDIESNTTANGLTVARFAIAVQRKYTNEAGEREVDFINIVAWRALAERCAQYLKKGSKVAICGTLQNRSFTGQDGIKKYVTEVIAEDVTFLTPKANESTVENKQDVKLQPIDDDNIPF